MVPALLVDPATMIPNVLTWEMLPYIDEVRKERRKKTKNDAVVRLASVIHEVSRGGSSEKKSCTCGAL